MAQSLKSMISHMSAILVVQWISVLSQTPAPYQRAYSGYLFTIPGVNDVKYRSQTEAQNWCNRDGRSSLLEISNATVQNAVVQFINDAMGQYQLIGSNIITNGKQNGSSWTWLTGTPAGDNFAISGQGGGQEFSYGYLNTSSSGYLTVADSPSTTKLYICEEKQTDCTNGFHTNGRCYRSFNDSRLSWYDARNRCLDRGGDLASFEWMSSSQGLNALNGSWLPSSNTYWIGLRRQFWTWQYSKTDVKYSQWSNGHPIDQTQQCICLVPLDWKWNECSCSQGYQFVCISAAPSSSSPSMSSTSTTTQSVGSSSRLANLTTSTVKGYYSTSSASLPSNNSSEAAVNSLAIGLGVGLGGAVLIAIIIVAVVLALKYNIHKRFSRRKLPPTATVTRMEETHYAVVQPKKQPAEGSSYTHNTGPSNNSSAEYAPITIRGTKTATIAPPNPTAAAGYSVL